jgi:hypothetical protein
MLDTPPRRPIFREAASLSKYAEKEAWARIKIFCNDKSPQGNSTCNLEE